jgi:hypothetical protein
MHTTRRAFANELFWGLSGSVVVQPEPQRVDLASQPDYTFQAFTVDHEAVGGAMLAPPSCHLPRRGVLHSLTASTWRTAAFKEKLQCAEVIVLNCIE